MQRIALTALVALSMSLIATSLLAAAEPTQPKDDNICAVFDRAAPEVKKQYEGWLRSDACEAIYWSEFDAKPADQLLPPQGFAAYRAALQREQCDLPLALIAKAFAAAYPRAPNILGNDEHFLSWKVRVVERRYPELAGCLRLQDIRVAQAEIEQQGLAAERYKSSRESLLAADLPPAVAKRNTAIYALMNLHSEVPSLLALARLSHAGKVIRFVPEYQYYLLSRLAHREVDPLQLAPMLTAVVAKLQPAEMQALDTQARAGKYAGPEPITK